MPHSMKYTYGKNVLITGGSSGIGRSCAELFAQNGCTVYSASRNPAQEIRKFDSGGEIRPLQMDITNEQSVVMAVESTLAQADIGIIVHSAGVGIACPAEEFPELPIERLLKTNFIGVLRLNHHLLPLLRNRGSGLCLMISSVAALFPIPFQSHYCSSKSALEAYAATLRMEMAEYNIKVALVLPGDTNTGFTGARSYEIQESSPYYDRCIKAVSKMEKDEKNGRSPLSVAKAVWKLSEKKNPPLRTIVGLDYTFLTFLRRLLPERLIEYILKKMYMG